LKVGNDLEVDTAGFHLEKSRMSLTIAQQGFGGLADGLGVFALFRTASGVSTAGGHADHAFIGVPDLVLIVARKSDFARVAARPLPWPAAGFPPIACAG